MEHVRQDASTESLEEAYRAHRVALLRLAYLVGASRELAEDVVQSAFAGAQPRWDHVDDPLAYLKRAVVNQVKDEQRRWYRRRRQRASEQMAPHVLPPEVDETWAASQRCRGLSAPWSSCTTTRTCPWWRSRQCWTAPPPPSAPTTDAPSTSFERHWHELHPRDARGAHPACAGHGGRNRHRGSRRGPSAAV